MEEKLGFLHFINPFCFIRPAYENRFIFSQCLSKEYTLRIGGDLQGEEKHPKPIPITVPPTPPFPPLPWPLCYREADSSPCQGQPFGGGSQHWSEMAYKAKKQGGGDGWQNGEVTVVQSVMFGGSNMNPRNS